MSASNRLTLEEIAAMDCRFITPLQASGPMECHPYNISLQARTPEGCAMFGFKVIRIGTRTKILRESFLEWMGWGNDG